MRCVTRLFVHHFFISFFPLPPTSTLFPYTTLFRSALPGDLELRIPVPALHVVVVLDEEPVEEGVRLGQLLDENEADRKSTRLNSSHLVISYAVFCLKKKTRETTIYDENVYYREC